MVVKFTKINQNKGAMLLPMCVYIFVANIVGRRLSKATMLTIDSVAWKLCASVCRPP